MFCILTDTTDEDIIIPFSEKEVEMNGKLKEQIAKIIIKAFPILKRLLEEQVIPRLKKRAYELFDNFADDRIEDLTDLVEKIKKTEDEDKKEKHLKGFSAGVSAIRAIAEKLLEACDVLEKEIQEEA